MAVNRGKAFEGLFKKDFKEIENASIDRLYDSVSGFKGVKNICDFITYIFPYIFYLELKTTKENTLNFSAIRQYDKLVEKIGIKGVNTGIVIWFIKNEKIVYVPIEEIKQLKESGYKSINCKQMTSNPDYEVYEVPTQKKRVNLKADYMELHRVAERRQNGK